MIEVAAFWNNASGAVTTDWVVLMAFLVSLGGLTASAAGTAMEGTAQDLSVTVYDDAARTASDTRPAIYKR